ncbi:MAG: hypothetical protein QUS33_07390 [Dehalococcoidia bacterium]|nr:hypothetical protein [Dehalococcoidia bacterium]
MKRLPVRAGADGLIRRLVLAACVILFLVSVPSATVAAATSSDGWATQTSGIELTLYGIWGTSPADVFAVGEGGTILHYDGTSWSSMSSGVSAALFGVWGSSSTDVFAVGETGTICHFDGNSWNSIPSGTSKHLRGVWGTDNESVFAVGYSGAILHYDGTSWSQMDNATSSHLTCVWGTSPADVFAAGNNGLVLHYDGISWSVLLQNSHPNFLSIWGVASNDAFAGGVGGMILHYDGISWSEMDTGVTSDLYGIWGASSTDVFAVGLDGTILHYDGSAWNEMDSGVAGSLRSIYGFSPLDAFAAGYGGTILHYRELPPKLTAVAPTQGNQGQTLDATITGNNLNTAISVSFGPGVTVNNYHADGSSQITANITVAATASAGPRDVSVSNPYGTDTLPGAFTVPSASISSVSPSMAKQGQTLNVSILGTNLGRASTAAFGEGIAATGFSVVSPDRLSVNLSISASASLGPRDVSVSTDEGSATLVGGFSVVERDPAIASVSPSSGKQGEVLNIAIEGVNLDGATGISLGDGVSVNNFNSETAAKVVASITISVTAPPGFRDVSVSTPDGVAVLPDAFEVTAEAPVITDISPRSGKIGQALSLSITGAHLGSTSSVSLGPGIIVESFTAAPDQIEVNIVISADASLGARDVSVVTAGGTATLSGGFIVYRLPPGIVGINPASGNIGETLDVIISGVNFFGTTGVDFGPGIRVNSFTVDSDTQITVNITILEDAEQCLHDVRITTATGSVEFPKGFDLKVADSAPGKISPSEYRPPGSANLWWIFPLLGGLAVVGVGVGFLVARTRGSRGKGASSAS